MKDLRITECCKTTEMILRLFAEQTMCLGVPGKIIEISQNEGLLMGRIDFGGVTQEACLAYVPEAKVGDYAVIHVGFALHLLDEAEALETLDLLRQIGELESAEQEDQAGNRPPNSIV